MAVIYMQIRIVSKKIQLLRAEYIPAVRTPEGHLKRGTGRATQKMFASFDRWLDKPPGDVLKKLTKEEQDQLHSWLEEKREKDREQALLVAIDLVEEYMTRAAKGIEEFGPIEAKKARNIQKACDRLSKSIKSTKNKKKRVGLKKNVAGKKK